MNKIAKLIFAFCAGFLFALNALCGQLNITLPDDAVMNYADRNPLREALRPVPATATFKMDGYCLWDPSAVKGDDTCHLFCSRCSHELEAQDTQPAWKSCHIIRATSKSLLGPYEFRKVVMGAEDHPEGKKGFHSVKVMTVGVRFLMYYIYTPGGSTGFSRADHIEDPWISENKIAMRASNPAVLVRDDGSVYALHEFKKLGRQGGCTGGYEASYVKGPFEKIAGGRNLLPYNMELEDPTLRWANNQYNVICTDWMGKVTGTMKSVVYYTAKDGVHYELYPKIPVWSQGEPVPMADGSERCVTRVERPQVFLNDDGDVTALLVSAGTEDCRHDYVIIRPVDHFNPKNPCIDVEGKALTYITQLNCI